MKAPRELKVDVLGTTFTVCWGSAVTAEQGESTTEAWGRCLSDVESSPLPKMQPRVSRLPFTAELYFHSKLRNVSVRHLDSQTFEGLAEDMTSAITVAAILERAGELTMLHACGVADSSGAVVALVARSGTGKTTASMNLARTLGYVSDETVAIRADGTVMAYPKPLSVKQATLGGAKLQVGPDKLGLQVSPDKLHIRAIALLDRVVGGEYQLPVVEPVPLVEAVLALIPDTSSQAAVVQPLQSLCRLIDSVGGVFRVSYSEAADLADSLEPLFGAETVKPAEVITTWSPALLELEAEPVHKAGGEKTEPIPAGWLQRTEVADAVAIGGDLLVLTDSEVIRLSGIGPIIWRSARRPVSMQTLAGHIEAEHGLPEGYEALLNAAVDGLADRGLILRG